MTDLYDFRYAREGAQLEQMRDLESRDVCIFCPEGLGERQHEVLRCGDYWAATENDYPYHDDQAQPVERSFILFSLVHTTSLEQLPSVAGSDLFRLCKWLTKFYGLTGGGLVIRFGDSRLTGATIKHLHAHLIVPRTDASTDRAVPVRFPIG